jgi:hypothetical protein
VHVPRQRPIGLRIQRGRATSRDRGQAQSLASTRVCHRDEWPPRFGADVLSATSWSVQRGTKSHQWRRSPAIDIAEAHIWVGLVNKGVEHLHGLPDTHAGTTAALEVHSSLDVECNSLFFCGGSNWVRFWRRKSTGMASYHVAPYRNS